MCKRVIVAVLLVLINLPGMVLANGGPFVVKYPKGDPAAKGVLARIGDDLMPGRETRLKVVKEELKIDFKKSPQIRFMRVVSTKKVKVPPLVSVSAEYTIENPTGEEVTVDFGFPILRGIYVPPMKMMPMPDARVKLGSKYLRPTIISNSAIYGIIRQKARAVIDKGIADDSELSVLVNVVRKSKGSGRSAAVDRIIYHLVNARKWNKRDAVLLSEYAGLDIGKIKSHPRDSTRTWGMFGGGAAELYKIISENLGPLSAIGEQKATQLFAQLATGFDKEAGSAYEKIFTAWGGDVRERVVDMTSGKIRPRKLDVNAGDKDSLTKAAAFDPTVYARVDFFDENAKISEDEKKACKAILKNLPVVFTFAPMNILYYQATFAAGKTEKLTVSYKQHAFKDTAGSGSYQLAYVVHPASFWDEFGPINLEVTVPEGVQFRASVPCVKNPAKMTVIPNGPDKGKNNIVYCANVKDKTGELFVAVDAGSWDKPAVNTAQQQQVISLKRK
ncbi:MAG: hypothetical protein FVQ82_09235 [Planctomycetes bacterium]|nr:hypothetical protein [Planctomycetota bacterium]